MDFRAVLTFLCLLIAQACCLPVRRGTEEALNGAVREMREDIRTALHHIDASGLLPNISCLSQNIAELVGPDQQLLTARNLSSIRCYMLEVSKSVIELEKLLKKISQQTLDMEQGMSGQTVTQNCSLPAFEQDSYDNFLFAKCLLQDLDERLCKAKF